jgi:succinate dehydrogenase/fumarate reductase flavoprotein subunit
VVAAGSEEKQDFWWGVLAHGVISKAHTLTEFCEDVQFISRKLSAIGFSVAESKIYIFKAKTILLAAGGCVNIFRPRSVGEGFMERNKALLDDYPPYGQVVVPPTCLRNHLMLKEMKEGRAPIWIGTVKAQADLRESLSPREVKYLEAEAWENFLDMCVGQCGVWAGEDIEPEKRNSELMPSEPYQLGSHRIVF